VTAASALLLTDTPLANALNDSALAARVIVDLNPRARRVSLRVDPVLGRIVLVRPKRMSDKAVIAFVASRRDWIARHLENLPQPVAFADGAIVPFRGQDHVIRWTGGARGIVTCEPGEICVPGAPEHAPRRLRDWLKAEARKAITPRVHVMAGNLEAKVTHISVRDTRSRWGSATRAGRLSFSWRLILAPEAVLTYVVAHEVAHLEHMNHALAFWRTVRSLLGEDPALAREWLRRSGSALHRYG